MAQDNTAGLGTMLAFLQQGSQSGSAAMPAMPDYSQINMPQMPQYQSHSGGSIGGLLKGIVGNTTSSLLSDYLGSKLQKHIDKGTAEDTREAYAPVLKNMRDNATNDSDKQFYGNQLEALNTGNPTIVGNTMESINKRILEASKLTNEQRNWADPQQQQRMIAEDAHKNQPTLRTMGVPGREGYKVNFYLDGNGQPVPVGEPFKEGGVNVNVGAPKSWIMPTDAEKMVNQQGQHPPVGTEWGSPEAKGYSVATAKNQDDIKQSGITTNFTNELNNLLFKPKTGLYANYGSETAENKVQQTVIQNWQKYAQTDPRYKQADDYIQSNLAPMIRSLGTVGNLSDADLERASGLLPVITGVNIDTPTVARGKMERFNKVIAAANQVNPVTGKINGITPEILNGAIGEPKPQGWTDQDEQDYQALLKSRQQ